MEFVKYIRIRIIALLTIQKMDFMGRHLAIISLLSCNIMHLQIDQIERDDLGRLKSIPRYSIGLIKKMDGQTKIDKNGYQEFKRKISSRRESS